MCECRKEFEIWFVNHVFGIELRYDEAIGHYDNQIARASWEAFRAGWLLRDIRSKQEG